MQARKLKLLVAAACLSLVACVHAGSGHGRYGHPGHGHFGHPGHGQASIRFRHHRAPVHVYHQDRYHHGKYHHGKYRRDHYRHRHGAYCGHYPVVYPRRGGLTLSLHFIDD